MFKAGPNQTFGPKAFQFWKEKKNSIHVLTLPSWGKFRVATTILDSPGAELHHSATSISPLREGRRKPNPWNLWESVQALHYGYLLTQSYNGKHQKQFPAYSLLHLELCPPGGRKEDPKSKINPCPRCLPAIMPSICSRAAASMSLASLIIFSLLRNNHQLHHREQ